jgi:catalase
MGKGKQKKDGQGVNGKVDDLAANTVEDQGEYLTTNQGVRVNDDQHTLNDGERGASLLEDFHLPRGSTHSV